MGSENKFGKGYQIEMKCKLVTKTDPDYIEIVTKLAQSGSNAVNQGNGDGEAIVPKEDELFFNLDQTISALQSLTGEMYLASVVNDQNPIGFKSTGAPLPQPVCPWTNLLRLRRSISESVEWTSILSTRIQPMFSARERQDTKVRYEVNSEGIKISSIFASLEANKERLLLDDFGVSQTSLEQVFNMHAAAAEELKVGTTDG